VDFPGVSYSGDGIGILNPLLGRCLDVLNIRRKCRNQTKRTTAISKFQPLLQVHKKTPIISTTNPPNLWGNKNAIHPKTLKTPIQLQFFLALGTCANSVFVSRKNSSRWDLRRGLIRSTSQPFSVQWSETRAEMHPFQQHFKITSSANWETSALRIRKGCRPGCQVATCFEAQNRCHERIWTEGLVFS